MKIIATLQDGRPQVAEVSLEEYNALPLKKGTERFIPNPIFGELETLRVYFNGKGEVCTENPYYTTSDNVSSRLFKKEALTKNGRLKKSTIKILNSLSK
ncbi:hypothetical protein ACUJ42_05275 [Streptococcus anginosus]|uniref:hypothetical protein n=1 Tax=Streptococcus anginosus TaxID=1328 RepID=UPI004041625C